MQILSRDSLTLGGFAGIKEHRLVTDSRIFGSRKKPEASEGLGSMVYLADAKYDPMGESGMHPHSEIDVISVVLEGRVSHEGSLEHGQNLVAGDVQVQRAGGEGFDHNEINPDSSKNRMLQIWALPEESGQCASYKSYTPSLHGTTRIYGGKKNQDKTFDSHTIIEIAHLQVGEQLVSSGEQLTYVISGESTFSEVESGEEKARLVAKEGDLVRGVNTTITAQSQLHLLVIREQS